MATPASPFRGGLALGDVSGRYVAVIAWHSDDLTCQGGLGASQVFALESAAFVLHTTAVLGPSCAEAMKLTPPWDTVGGGSSAVIGPDGRRLTEPLPPTEEGIVYADLDKDVIVSCRHFVDACGHYSRPDLLWLGVDTQEKAHHRPAGGRSVSVARDPSIRPERVYENP